MKRLSPVLNDFLRITALLAVATFSINHALAIAPDSNEPSWKELDTNGFAEAKVLTALLQKPDAETDLARVKLTIDKMVDPSIDIEANLKTIDAIVAGIRASLSAKPSDAETLAGIRRYLYEPGPWNGNRAYSYDMEDPLGTTIANKLLPRYLDTRKGNCVSMPFLFIILGQRLGLDVTASTAPFHVFVKYTDRQTKQTVNLETTSGGNVARDVWIRQQNPMSDAAISNGVYMQPLTKKETIAEMALVLAESYSAKQQYKKAILISDVILAAYPKSADSMARKGYCFYKLLQSDFSSKYSSTNLIPAGDRDYFNYLSYNANYWRGQALAIGWQPADDQQDTEYLKRVENDKAKAN